MTLLGYSRIQSSLLLAVVLVLAFATWAGADKYGACEFASTRNAVELVRDAVTLINEKGEAAFADFSVKGSRWYQGNKYLFIHDTDGVLVCNPAFSGMQGTNMIDFRDVSGKPSVRFMIDQAKKGGGWVHYFWPRPGHLEPSWKSSFVEMAQAPDGKEYVVATGLYDAPMEQCFVVQMVEDAVAYLTQHGTRGFDLLRNRKGPFVWQDNYVFILGRDGTQYVNPAFPEFEGVDVRQTTDTKNNRLFQMMLDGTESGKAHWIEYWWPKPGYREPTLKKVYIRSFELNGREYLVGSGMYAN